MGLIELFALIKQIGVPPGLEENESHLRAWYKHTTTTLAEMAEITDDPKARRATHISQMIALDDDLWYDFYTLLQRAREKSLQYYPPSSLLLRKARTT